MESRLSSNYVWLWILYKKKCCTPRTQVNVNRSWNDVKILDLVIKQFEVNITLLCDDARKIRVIISEQSGSHDKKKKT